jgi:hypothetical protein
VRTNSVGVSHKEQFWFCADTACTAPRIVLAELQKYKWNVSDACVAGVKVKVIGSMTPASRASVANLNLILVK